MKSGSCSLSGVFLLLMLIPGFCRAQAPDEFSAFRAAYPGHSIITEINEKSVSFELLSSETIRIREKDYNSKYILTGNASLYSASKEYFNPRAGMESFRAYTRVPQGKGFRDYPAKDLVKGTEIDDGLFYDDTYTYSFNFPAVAGGTRLITESETVMDDPYFPVIFNFGDAIPTHKSRLTLTFPPSVKISYRMYGIDTSMVQFTSEKKGKQMIYRWEATQTPALTSDEFSPGIRYYIPHVLIHISEIHSKDRIEPVMGTIADLFKWHKTNVGRLRTETDPAIRTLSDSLTAQLRHDEEKAEAIFRWVQQYIRYIAIEDGDNSFIPREAGTVLKNRYGDCKDKSNLLKAMLGSAGLNAGLGWIGTRDLPYRYSDFPSIANDNHMICIWWKEPDKPVFLDGTTQYHNIGQIPAFIQGKECLAETAGHEFQLLEVPVESADLNIIQDSLFLSFRQGRLTGSGTMRVTGENKAQFTGLFKRAEKSRYNELMMRIKPFASNKFIASDISTTESTSSSQPFMLAYHLDLPDYAVKHGDNIYLNMHTERILQNYRVKNKRLTPFMNESCFSRKSTVILEIPEDMEVVSLPENSSFQHPDFGFKIQYHKEGSRILMVSEITVNLLLIEGGTLAEFDEMIDNLKKAYLNSIVLNKI
ncbi:hypothetical protein SDC9_33560 [bioreactor metagenome]|uniref:Transglutaminase-like domain-containing protein n=1 Tax=bioreactor metagenome TaxID=1076179 RepID=A0A644V886_9ZZZZ|nr:DUF3857 domain-containing protein [Lentimicrobium sp.]MEA5109874.1 DUF3857 domain-containing protein [Lentimicrobium sp.]